MPAPEATARQHIDRALTESGWAVLDIADANLDASRGVAIREFPLTTGHGFADYVLFVDGRAAGVIEAKKAGTTLTGVELQAAKYSAGFPDAFPAPPPPAPVSLPEHRPGNPLQQPPRPRAAHPPRLPVPPARDPGRLAGRCPARRAPRCGPAGPARSACLPRFATACASCRRCVTKGLWPAQERAIRNLEASLADDRPRAHPDGHRQRQDVHGDLVDLPADQVRRRPPGPVPGRSGQPRPADA